MSKPPKGQKRVVRKRPLTSSFKPRPSAEIDDRPYFKKRRPDRDDGPRREYNDGPARGRGGSSRGFGGPPRGKGKFGDRRFDDRPRPPRDDRKSEDIKFLMATVKRLESGMTEALDRLARIEKQLAGKD